MRRREGEGVDGGSSLVTFREVSLKTRPDSRPFFVKSIKLSAAVCFIGRSAVYVSRYRACLTWFLFASACA